MVTMTTDPKHPELGPMPFWDLTDLYPAQDSPELQRDLRESASKAKAFRADHEGQLATLSGAALGRAVAAYEAIEETLGRLQTYAYLTYSVAVNDPDAGAFLQGIREKVTEISSDLLFFTLELNRLDDAVLADKLTDPALATYQPWLRDLRVMRPHQLSDELEQYLHQTSVVGSAAWVRLFDETLAALRFTINGETMNEPAALKLLQSPDRAVRQAAATELARVFRQNLPLFTLITNTLAKSKEIDDRWRKLPTPQASRHLSNLIEEEVVGALQTAVKQAYPRLSHRYYALKAKWLGLEKLAYWDRNAPLPEKPERVIPWAEAKAIVLKAYGDFSPELAHLIEPFFERGWIDAPARDGKEGGAYSHPAVVSVHPYILMNYLGKDHDVMTLAHELGHGAHQILAAPQGQLISDTPLTLAETASVFGEMLTFRSLLAREENPIRRKIMIAEKVESMLATVVRQIAFYDFELRVHTERRNGELSPDRLGEIWLEVMQESLGPSFTSHADYATFWCYVTHFIHAPFYVYAYAFGDCLVNALYATYQAEPDGFVEKYMTLLKSGGRYRHKELLAPFGLDATDPAFWNRGLSVIEGLIDELERMG